MTKKGHQEFFAKILFDSLTKFPKQWGNASLSQGDGRPCGWIWMNEWMNGWMDGWMNERTDGRTDGWMGG